MSGESIETAGMQVGVRWGSVRAARPRRYPRMPSAGDLQRGVGELREESRAEVERVLAVRACAEGLIGEQSGVLPIGRADLVERIREEASTSQEDADVAVRGLVRSGRLTYDSTGLLESSRE